MRPWVGACRRRQQQPLQWRWFKVPGREAQRVTLGFNYAVVGARRMDAASAKAADLNIRRCQIAGTAVGIVPRLPIRSRPAPTTSKAPPLNRWVHRGWVMVEVDVVDVKVAEGSPTTKAARAPKGTSLNTKMMVRAKVMEALRIRERHRCRPPRRRMRMQKIQRLEGRNNLQQAPQGRQRQPQVSRRCWRKLLPSWGAWGVQDKVQSKGDRRWEWRTSRSWTRRRTPVTFWTEEQLILCGSAEIGQSGMQRRPQWST